mmetsp:Transcript_38137/g.105048  ORF Transcript_38137/g.105048 Transcript_38137/m.105048 type:complete len:250 (-) Transcript_38137:217-966(-)
MPHSWRYSKVASKQRVRTTTWRNASPRGSSAMAISPRGLHCRRCGRRRAAAAARSLKVHRRLLESLARSSSSTWADRLSEPRRAPCDGRRSSNPCCATSRKERWEPRWTTRGRSSWIVLGSSSHTSWATCSQAIGFFATGAQTCSWSTPCGTRRASMAWIAPRTATPTRGLPSTRQSGSSERTHRSTWTASSKPYARIRTTRGYSGFASISAAYRSTSRRALSGSRPRPTACSQSSLTSPFVALSSNMW